MTTSWTAIASVTVGVLGTSSIDFTSIPGTYTDLCLKTSLRTNGVGAVTYAFMGMTANGTTSGYSDIHLIGNGSGAGSFSNTGAASYRQSIITNNSIGTANTFSNVDVYIPNYAGSANKSISVDAVNENNGTGAYAILSGNLLSNTSAITSLSIFQLDAQTILQYSTATLFGIKNT